jgi:hypothetical protein
VPILDRITIDLSIEEGHAIIASTSKPHNMAFEKAIQVFALKGLAVPTLQNSYYSFISSPTFLGFNKIDPDFFAENSSSFTKSIKRH